MGHAKPTPTRHPEPLLLRVDEAASLLAVSRSKLYAMLKSGELRALRVGVDFRIPRAELERWIAQQVERGAR